MTGVLWILYVGLAILAISQSFLWWEISTLKRQKHGKVRSREEATPPIILDSLQTRIEEIEVTLKEIQESLLGLERQISEAILPVESLPTILSVPAHVPALPPPPLELPTPEQWKEGTEAFRRLYAQELRELQRFWGTAYYHLVTDWQRLYVDRSPNSWTAEEFTGLDMALYQPLQIPSVAGVEIPPILVQLETLLLKLQTARIAELARRGITRIEGVRGVTRINPQEIVSDTKSKTSLPEPPSPEYAQTYHSIEPGNGGYKYNGKVLKVTQARFYKQYEENP